MTYVRDDGVLVTPCRVSCGVVMADDQVLGVPGQEEEQGHHQVLPHVLRWLPREEHQGRYLYGTEKPKPAGAGGVSIWSLLLRYDWSADVLISLCGSFQIQSSIFDYPVVAQHVRFLTASHALLRARESRAFVHDVFQHTQDNEQEDSIRLFRLFVMITSIISLHLSLPQTVSQ